jgi:hypothetical protein
MSVKQDRRFSILSDEGAFFDEPWLRDNLTGKDHRYDEVPSEIKKEFAEELRAQGKMNPEEASLVIGWLIHG